MMPRKSLNITGYKYFLCYVAYNAIAHSACSFLLKSMYSTAGNGAYASTATF